MDILEVLFYNGILGFLPFAAFMISFIWASIKKFLKDKKDKITDNELVSGLLMTVVILISNLFLSSTTLWYFIVRMYSIYNLRLLFLCYF